MFSRQDFYTNSTKLFTEKIVEVVLLRFVAGGPVNFENVKIDRKEVLND